MTNSEHAAPAPATADGTAADPGEYGDVAVMVDAVRVQWTGPWLGGGWTTTPADMPATIRSSDDPYAVSRWAAALAIDVPAGPEGVDRPTSAVVWVDWVAVDEDGEPLPFFALTTTVDVVDGEVASLALSHPRTARY